MGSGVAETRSSVKVRGIVQGVGFRPFVHRLVRRHGLRGWVRNTSEGAELELAGAEGEIADFLREMVDEAPPLAMIESVSSEELPGEGGVRGLQDYRERQRGRDAHPGVAGHGNLPGLPEGIARQK